VRAAAVTVQILILGAATIEGALPELAQVRGDKTVAVCGSAQAGGERVCAIGAVACSVKISLIAVSTRLKIAVKQADVCLLYCQVSDCFYCLYDKSKKF